MSTLLHSSLTGVSQSSPLVEEQEHVNNLKALLMKRLAWMVLCAYTLLMFRPVMPIVMDVLAHTFWEQQHMLVVHEVDGQFHVHNELINASHQAEKDKQQAKVVTDDYMPVKRIVTALPVAFLSFNVKQDTYATYSCYYPSSSSELDVPPPRA